MVRRCAARPRLSSLGPLTALMCSQFTPFHFLLLRSPAWHVILLHFTPLGLCAPSLCQCSVPSLHSALLLAALRSSVAVAAGEALRQAGGRGSSSAGSGGGGARGRGSAIQPAGRGAETELAGAPAATGTRVRKGRGFTSQYAFARRYRTPSPSPSPSHSLSPDPPPRSSFHRYSGERGRSDRLSREEGSGGSRRYAAEEPRGRATHDRWATEGEGTAGEKRKPSTRLCNHASTLPCVPCPSINASRHPINLQLHARPPAHPPACPPACRYRSSALSGGTVMSRLGRKEGEALSFRDRGRREEAGGWREEGRGSEGDHTRESKRCRGDFGSDYGRGEGVSRERTSPGEGDRGEGRWCGREGDRGVRHEQRNGSDPER